MYKDKFFSLDKKIISYCAYCQEPITEDEGFIYINGKYYHYDPKNRLNNCYFPKKDEE